MKVAAYYPIHYGIEYLDVSIKAIDPFVEKIYILYSRTPSYGHGTSAQCPESEEEIKAVAMGASKKIEWIEISAHTEGYHRDLIFKQTNGYDVLIACDADEVWDPIDLERCIKETYEGTAWRRNVLGFIHFWKSFNVACVDHQMPGRLYNLNNNNRAEEPINGKIYHFGYAQSNKIMDYKFEIHGHKNELRPNWLQSVYYNWKEGDRFLHPVSFDIWKDPIEFNKEELPELIKSHPNFHKDTIC